MAASAVRSDWVQAPATHPSNHAPCGLALLPGQASRPPMHAAQATAPMGACSPNTRGPAPPIEKDSSRKRQWQKKIRVPGQITPCAWCSMIAVQIMVHTMPIVRSLGPLILWATMAPRKQFSSRLPAGHQNLGYCHPCWKKHIQTLTSSKMLKYFLIWNVRFLYHLQV